MSKTTLALYILSVVLVFYATYELYNAIVYIMEYMDAGSISFSSNMNDIVSFVTQACLDIYLKAIIFYILAKAYQTLIDLKKETAPIEG